MNVWTKAKVGIALKVEIDPLILTHYYNKTFSFCFYISAMHWSLHISYPMFKFIVHSNQIAQKNRTSSLYMIVCPTIWHGLLSVSEPKYRFFQVNQRIRLILLFRVYLYLPQAARKTKFDHFQWAQGSDWLTLHLILMQLNKIYFNLNLNTQSHNYIKFNCY